MEEPQEYEVESVTRARVHDKKGKKITWRYYVKWKGYEWDESTWEPRDSFQGGSEHILESFWERIDTGGRDISDATAFKKGEELLISGPPGRKGLKRKANPPKTPVSPSRDVPSPNGVSISAPLPTRKRRRVQVAVGDEWGYSKPRRSASTVDLMNGGTSARSNRRRRSSPGVRKPAKKRHPSAGDSQLDADGETDPDVVEVEDELMQVSPEDPEEDGARARGPTTLTGSGDGSNKIAFDDLEHFYSGNPIDIDQNTEEQVPAPKQETRPRQQSPPAVALPSDDTESRPPASPALSSSEPLFGSPPNLSDEAPESQEEPVVPAHRARATNPLVKLIDTTTHGTTSKESRITAKARLMSIHKTDVPSTSDQSRIVARRGGKPGPGRSSSGLITKNRSSLLVATKGSLKSVKGKYAGTSAQHDEPDEIEEDSVIRNKAEGDKLHDEDAVAGQDHQAMSNSQSGPPPSGDELLKLAGFDADMEPLPDYEDVTAPEPQAVETQGSTSAPASSHEEIKSSVEVKVEPTASGHAADPLSSESEAEQKAEIPVTSDQPVPTAVVPPADEAVKANIELAKEHLFPSTQTPSNSFNVSHSSFRSTIFGPLYQGSAANDALDTKNEPSTTFKVILGDGNELPLVLKDCSEIKSRIGDILIGNSSGSKVALFYSAEDALAMVNTLKGDGTARVVLDPSAETMRQECFSTFLQRFEFSRTLVAPVGTEVCVLYSSENADIAEKLGAPAHLRGLSSTLLISHASIENQLAYVAAIMKAAAL